MPGVTHASAINMLPIAATGTQRHRAPRRSDWARTKAQPVTEMRQVMPGYFDAMGMRLLAGRAIDERDRAGTPVGGHRQRDAGVAPVARRCEPRPWSASGFAPVGTTAPRIEVVGVVANVRSRRPDAPPDPELYAAFAQVPAPAMSYVVRSTGDPAALTRQIRATLAQMTPNVALAAVRTFDEVVTTSTRTSGLLSWLSALFGALAAALAILGIYSVMSYTVAQRERELAIRAAVGASRSTLLSLVLREGLLLSAAGIAAGALIAFAASGVLRHACCTTSARPIRSVFVALGGRTGAWLRLAGYLIPATRASRVEPVMALRSE